MHQQEYRRIQKHPFTQRLAPHESAVTSNGLTDKEFGICLAPKGITYSSNSVSDPDFVHEAAFLILSWVLKSYPSSLGIWPLAHPWFRVTTLPPAVSRVWSWFCPARAFSGVGSSADTL